MKLAPMILFIAVVPALAGCSGKHTYDLSASLEQAMTLNELAPAPTDRAIGLEVNHAADDRHALGRTYRPGMAFTSAKDGEARSKQAIDELVAQACIGALRSRGFEPVGDGSPRLIVGVERCEMDYHQKSNSARDRDGYLEATVAVVRGDTETYVRRFAVMASREGGTGGSMLGILSPLGGAIAGNAEDTETVVALFGDLFAKLQRELLADDDLLAALRADVVAAAH